MTVPETFHWLRHPDAESYLLGHLDQLVAAIPSLRAFSLALPARTGSRLIDWLDHLVLADGDLAQGQLADLGFEIERVPAEPGDTVYYHPGTILPRVLLRERPSLEPGNPLALAIQVEDISHFLMANQLSVPVAGSLVSPYRRALIWQQDGRAVLLVERRGYPGYVPTELPPDYPQHYLRTFEAWATRPRLFASERAGMEHALNLARSLVRDMGTHTAAWIAFAAERAYWQGRNRAGQLQKASQDSLGLGWANHDHHTFRSSRQSFPLLIEILETFGFQSRERFYAGAEAGWGAQVMEQPVCRFAVFADADLSEDEVDGDFAHSPLPARDELGTVGLWCALHGQSMLSAGLHHLAGRFDFDQVAGKLREWGIGMMSPFSEFPYLRQAFTHGERWPVAPDRLAHLVAAGQINQAQRASFAEKGAIGSHLENIQRGEGFKGFNQQTISDIILRTDPRARTGTA